MCDLCAKLCPLFARLSSARVRLPPVESAPCGRPSRARPSRGRRIGCHARARVSGGAVCERSNVNRLVAHSGRRHESRTDQRASPACTQRDATKWTAGMRCDEAFPPRMAQKTVVQATRPLGSRPSRSLSARLTCSLAGWLRSEVLSARTAEAAGAPQLARRIPDLS